MKLLKKFVSMGFMPWITNENNVRFQRYYNNNFEPETVGSLHQEALGSKASIVRELKGYDSRNIDATVCDIETTGLNPYMERIRLISFADGDNIDAIEDMGKLGDLLADNSKVKVFHNATFDTYFLAVKGYPVSNYEDTMIMAQILSNNEGKHSLEHLCRQYLDVTLDKSLQKPENWQGWLFDIHFDYAKRDSEVTLCLYRVLRNELIERNLWNVYQREIKALPAIVRMQLDGMPFDSKGWNSALQDYKRKRNAIEDEIKAELKTEINVASPKQLLTCLRNRGLHLKSTNDEELAKWESQSPVIAKLRRWRELNKLCTSYGETLVQSVRAGRIHSSWRLIGATTGRMSCKDPNLQQVPRYMRPYFKAPAGRNFIIADYSQIELRIMAELAQEEVMIDAFKHNEDLHTKTATMILKKNNITKDERQIAKACNFGLIYGMTAQGLKINLKTAYGLDVTEQEADVFRNGFFRLYPAIRKWQDRQCRGTSIRTVGGRIWNNIPKPTEKGYRNRFNYPVQGTGAEGLKESLGLLISGLPDEWKLCAVVHDEIVLEVPENQAEQAKAYLVACMKGGMQKLIKVVPVEVDAKISDSWEK